MCVCAAVYATTWHSVDEPGELLLGDGCPGEVKGHWLALDDA